MYKTLPLRTYKQMYKTLPLRACKQMYKTLPLRTYKQMYKTLPLRTYKQMYKTLPLRTYKQMYKTLPPKDILEPTRNVKLVAHNGQEIPCLRSINLQLRFGKTKQKLSRRPSSMSLMFHQHLLLVCQHARKLD